jgi:hypothetical protein
VLLLILAAGAGIEAQQGTRMLHEPDISAERVVFVYAGDLRAGGRRRSETPDLPSGLRRGPRVDAGWMAVR